jgi:hypothetical protein
MAAPSYTTDLNDISTCESTTDFDESSNAAWDDGGAMTQEGDYYIQGDYCVSSALKTGRGTIIYDTSTTYPLANGEVFLAWCYCIGPSAMASYALGGIGLLIGNSFGDFYNWDVWGADYYTYGGWVCIPIDPTLTVSDTVGSPTGSWSHFGASYNITGQISKGNTIGVDVMRYGRAEAIFEDGDGTNGYCTFAGFAAVNDATTARWGLFQAVAGGYLWQGLMSLGKTTSGGTAVDFRDSNVLIFIAQQLKVQSSFNRIEINDAASRVDWTNIVFKATGTVSPGQLEVIDNADVNIDACSFLDMDTFVFLANSSVVDTNFVQCGQVTQGGGTFTGCVFDSCTDSISLKVANAIASVTNCEFVSAGDSASGYAIEGFSTAGAYSLTGLTFTGYAAGDGSTGQEAIHVTATSGTVTLNISGGTTPSVHSEGAIIVKVVDPVDLTVTAQNEGGTVIENALVYLKAKDGAGPFPFEETVTITNADDSGGPTAYVTHTGHGMASNDYVSIEGASYPENNGVFQITVTSVNAYNYELASYPGASPSGTIKATFVALYGLTNASGIKTGQRVYSANQNVEGWVRKSSATPFYKSSPLVGEVDKDIGYTATAVMISDE